jgi:hypothetical protein
MSSVIGWAHRRSRQPIDPSRLKLGLWILDEALDRRPTALVATHREIVARGTEPVGRLAGGLGS